MKRVVAGIAEKDGKLLMFHSKKHNLWEFPGGKVEEGETDVDALKREWREELKKMVADLDKGNSDRLDFSEFLELMVKKMVFIMFKIIG